MRLMTLRKMVVRTLAALGLIVVLVTFSPLLRWWTTLLARPWQDGPAEVLIVLAAEEVGGEYPGLSSYWRCITAARAWKQGDARRLLVSGGGAGKGPATAETMKRFMVSAGVPETAIDAETASRSTRENALFVAARLRGTAGRKVLLTSDYHMCRASRAFRAAGLEVVGRPAPDAGKRIQRLAERWPVFLTLIEESAKIVYYRARGWL